MTAGGVCDGLVVFAQEWSWSWSWSCMVAAGSAMDGVGPDWAGLGMAMTADERIRGYANTPTRQHAPG
jgi:hypothetical protein